MRVGMSRIRRRSAELESLEKLRIALSLPERLGNNNIVDKRLDSRCGMIPTSQVLDRRENIRDRRARNDQSSGSIVNDCQRLSTDCQRSAFDVKGFINWSCE